MITMPHREQLFRLLQQRMFDIQAKKGRDYGEETDGLKNLRRRGRTGVIARMGDKFTRLENLVGSGRKPEVEDETIEDTLIDLAIYCLLLIILMWDEDGKTPPMKVWIGREKKFTDQQAEEMFSLLELINSEFQSDPTSVQCFDLRIVDRVKQMVTK